MCQLPFAKGSKPPPTRMDTGFKGCEGKCVNAIRLGTVNVSTPRGTQSPVFGDDQPMKARTMAALSRGSIGIRCTKLGGELP